MKFLFICSRLEPGHCGVGDYTRRLAGELIRMGHSSTIIALNDHLQNLPANELNNQNDGDTKIPVLRLSKNEPWNSKIGHLGKLVETCRPDIVSLQYVPHGYQQKGLPFEFANRLSTLPKAIHWHVMLHELWIGFGKLSEVKRNVISLGQRIVLKRILNSLAPSLITTSTSRYGKRLPRQNIKLLPLFSNIAPCAAPNINRDDRHNNAAVFGAFSRDVESFASQLNVVAKLAEVTGKLPRLNLLGRRSASPEHLDAAIEILGSDAIVDLGPLSESELSKQLSKMDLGISRADAELFPKSGSTLAFLEHGIPVLLRGDRTSSLDLEQSEYGSLIYFSDDSFSILPARGEIRSGVSQVADRFLKLIDSAT